MVSESASSFRLPIAVHCLAPLPRYVPRPSMASTVICFSCLCADCIWEASNKPPTKGAITVYDPMPHLPTDRISQRRGSGLQVPSEGISGHEFDVTISALFFWSMPRTLRVRAVLTGTRIRITAKPDRTDIGYSNMGHASDIAVPHILFGHLAADLPTSATQGNTP